VLGWVLLLGVPCAWAQDWPQWRGPNRDNKVVGFMAPATWPKKLTLKWKTPVGVGEASPALVGDKIYAFGRQGGDEVTSCLDAATGKVLWQDKYAVAAPDNAAKGHPGPRSSPAVAEGKVCTLGLRGMLSCLDAATGKEVWRKDTKSWPQYFTASSPLIVDGKCVAYIGDPGKGPAKGKGEVVAYDLASGKEAWKWTGAGPPYGSPTLMTVDGTKQIVTPTVSSLVGLNVADGKQLWQAPFSAKYMNATPIVDGQTVIYSGPGGGTVALKVEKQGDKFTAKQLWKEKQAPHQYNTPVLKDGVLYGLTGAGKATNLFCMDAKTGKVLWTDSAKRGECGTVLDAGNVLVALSSDNDLVVFQPSPMAFKEIARYKVADTPSWSYPILAGNRVFVKDRDSVALWTIE
jgi:outer membrane protein assembly factor BamB